MRFILVDRITELGAERARGIKCISLSDDTLAEHFPGLPIFPGVLVLESLAQLAGALLDAPAVEPPRLSMLVGIDRARFRRRVVPGDRVVLEAEIEQRLSEGARVRVVAMVGDERAAEATLSYAFVGDLPPGFVEERMKILRLMQNGQWYR